jgi:MarR family transcriptional regulator, 2-MHQ and catechol-resistance regulon repressor
MTRRYVDQRQKTKRAFAAYFDLLDTATWFEAEMGKQLKTFDLTMMEFRVLEALYRNGPQYQEALSRKFQCSKQNVGWVLKSLRRQGLIRRSRATLPKKKSSLAKTATGRRIVRMRLTPRGREWIAWIFPKHAKVVKSHMRAIDGREQQTLSRVCRKLRGGDIIKFVREITMDREGGV